MPKKPSGMVLKSQKLTISIKITENFEYGLNSVDRPKSTVVDKKLLGDKCPRGLVWSTSRDTCQVE